MINNIQKCWAPLGERPVIQKRIRREYVYGYAAVFPQLGQMTALVLPKVNVDMMSIFLKQVSEEYKDYFIVMQVDQAGWHSSQKVELPENIRLIKQPAYSPEVNPVEHVWEDIREKEFANVLLPSINDVVNKLCSGFMRLINNPEYFSSLTGFEHLNMIF